MPVGFGEISLLLSQLSTFDLAAFFGKEAACKVLLKAGADPAIKDDYGKSARDYGRDKHGWGDAFWR